MTFPDGSTEADFAEAEREREAHMDAHRRFTNPMVETYRILIPRMPTSQLLGFFLEPASLVVNTKALGDLSQADKNEAIQVVSAVAVSIGDEIDRRIPRRP